jgi:hypothetical protein
MLATGTVPGTGIEGSSGSGGCFFDHISTSCTGMYR